MYVILCKIQTKHDQIRPININFRNLHKISKFWCIITLFNNNERIYIEIYCENTKMHKILTVFNIDFQNLHKISEILVYRNYVHQFVDDGRKFGCYLMDYLKDSV